MYKSFKAFIYFFSGDIVDISLSARNNEEAGILVSREADKWLDVAGTYLRHTFS